MEIIRPVNTEFLLDQQLEMLRQLEINFTCPECFGVFREEGMIEILSNCGHSFCINCINSRLDKIPLPKSIRSTLSGGDPKTASKNISMMVAVRCSTCFKLSRHPLLETASSSSVSSTSPPPSMCSSNHNIPAIPMSIATISPPNNSDNSDEDKSLTLRSWSQLNLLSSTKIQILVKDLYCRTIVVTVSVDERVAEVKKKLAKIFQLPVAELQVRFFGDSSSSSACCNLNNGADSTAGEFGLFDKATLRLINTRPSPISWWSRLPASSFLPTESPFTPKTAAFFDYHRQ